MDRERLAGSKFSADTPSSIPTSGVALLQGFLRCWFKRVELIV